MEERLAALELDLEARGRGAEGERDRPAGRGLAHVEAAAVLSNSGHLAILAAVFAAQRHDEDVELREALEMRPFRPHLHRRQLERDERRRIGQEVLALE